MIVATLAACSTDDRFSITLTLSGESPEVRTGQVGFDEYLLVMSFDDDPDEFEFFSITHIEPNQGIRGGTVYESVDCHGDGVDEDSEIDFEFIRSS